MFTVYFDTEFTSTKKDVTQGLISLGCVAQDGKEWYRELSDTWDEVHCSLFTIETVLPLLQGGDCVVGVETFAAQLKSWLESLTDQEIVLRSDCPYYDWKFVQEIFDFHGWPQNLRKKCGTIHFAREHQASRYQAALKEYWKEHAARQHHALEDARSLFFAYKKSIKRGI